MGLFSNLFHKDSFTQKFPEEPQNDKEYYGKAWLLIMSEKKQQGLRIMQELDANGFIEATISLSMFSESPNEKLSLVKKAADANHPEGLWEYCCLLPHSYLPDPSNAADAQWERLCLEAAELGCVDAMNEMGNIFHRRKHYAESMYWYVMANANDHKDATTSMHGIAHEWLSAGAPYDFQTGSEKFNNSRHQCAIAYLELYADKELSVSLHEIMISALAGEPIAAYLAADLFESSEQETMAYKAYNVIAAKNDAHGIKCLADMVYTGNGTERDPQTALRMYTMAANMGERSSMFILGEFIKQTNPYLAAYWYGVSHSRGYEHSLYRLYQLANE